MTISYTIWFTQRVGSTWLCDLLSRTGVAGRPGEHLNFATVEEAFNLFGTEDHSEILAKVLALGSTANGVFGIKQGYSRSGFAAALTVINPNWMNWQEQPSIMAWESAFPCHRHIFLTRRNKLRLAVSWWKAIKTNEWHRRYGQKPTEVDLDDAYDAIAIRQLLNEAVAREAGISEMMSAAGVVPLTLVYEDILRDPQRAVDQALDHIGLPRSELVQSNLQPLADELSEKWVQEFRGDLQKGWPNQGW
ncbi:MAG: Stf0 family sulfotransferase [Pseudomonadota bacterium]